MYKWDEMTAYERDALVAEKVMVIVNREQFLINRRLNGTGRYSTDISAAWEVVEEFQSHMVWIQKFPEFEKWEAIIATLSSRYSAYETTASEAICKAALKAVGVDIE